MRRPPRWATKEWADECAVSSIYLYVPFFGYKNNIISLLAHVIFCSNKTGRTNFVAKINVCTPYVYRNTPTQKHRTRIGI